MSSPGAAWRRSNTVRASAPAVAGARLPSAIVFASHVDGLRLVLASAVGDHYRVKVSEDG